MSYTLTIPFYAFNLTLLSGETLRIPMKDGQAMRVNEPMHLLAGRYANVLQRKVFDKGTYQETLNQFQTGDYQKGSIQVQFKESRDRIRHPDFSIDFDYFYEVLEDGVWAIVPALGIECLTKETTKLEAVLTEAIHLEFARKGRLNALQNIISTLWYESIELEKGAMDMRFHSQLELETLHETQQELLLPQVAKSLSISQQEVYGRTNELSQITKALRSSFAKNVLLVGAPGVGKTALVWEIARQKEKRGIKGEIWETTASTLIKELTRETGWQDNMVFLCKELAKRGDFLFVRNLMELFEVGHYQGNSVSMAEYMSGYIGRGEVHLISECTEGELAKIELKSPQFISYFQVIRLEEPKEDLETIILNKVGDLGEKRGIELDKEAIQETLRLNRRFTPYAGFPGKPIRFLESLLINQKTKRQEANRITRTAVINQFCEETGMPRFIVDPSIPMNMDKVKGRFQSNIFGQEKAVNSVVDMLATVKTSLTRTGKPIASFLFVGPTGVGKTEMAKVLAEFMFGSRERMIRFDMSEYATPYSVMTLIGTDYHSNGRLTSAVRREPFCVLLFDEIEKAHPNFYDLLLQLLSEGRLTDSQGKLVNFCSTIIIMTSNVGAGKLQTNSIGFSEAKTGSDVAAFFETAIQKFFRPELYNRIDQVIPFFPLTQEVIRFVLDRELDLLKKREGLRFRKLDLLLDSSVYSHFSKVGYASKYGARYLQRSLREGLIIPLAKAINIEDHDDQLIVKVSVEKGEIQIDVEADPIGFDLMLEELDKINLAEMASESRRNIFRFQEGHFYIQLQSELTILEREKKRKKEKFWENADKVTQYTNLLQTQKELEELKTEIEEIELNLSLACLGQRAYRLEWEEAVKEWGRSYQELKIAFYARRFLTKNMCRFNLYGRNTEKAVRFYTNLFAQQGYKVTGELLWYEPDYFNEIVKKAVPKAENSADEAFIEAKRQDYKRTPWMGHFHPSDEGDLLVGVEFMLMGKAVMTYLEEEVGLQEWKFSDKDKSKYLVRIETADFVTPIRIHNPKFYNGMPVRRKVEANLFYDKPYDLNKQMAQKEHLSLLQKTLEVKFKGKIDGALM